MPKKQLESHKEQKRRCWKDGFINVLCNFLPAGGNKDKDLMYRFTDMNLFNQKTWIILWIAVIVISG